MSKLRVIAGGGGAGGEGQQRPDEDQLLAKQKLLELDDPVSRLEILYRYLEPRGLVK